MAEQEAVFPDDSRKYGYLEGIWMGSIIYISALSGIDPQLYEAAALDGAGRWKKMLYITLPGLIPVITINLILSMAEC